GIRDDLVTGVQTCALPIYVRLRREARRGRDQPRPNGHASALAETHEPACSGARACSGACSFAVEQLELHDRGELERVVDRGDVRSEERRVGKEGWWRRGGG